MTQQNIFNSVLASAIHDMKNSLAILLNDMDSLELNKSLPEDEKDKLLRQMRYEGQRLNNNFIQLLSLYRIDNKQYSANIAENCVYDILEEAYLENELLLNNRSIALEIACDENLLWFCDKMLLLGVINTLINNAYRYANEAIKLKASVSDGILAIKIMDDGPGYPDNILNPDDEAQKEINFQTGNTGLGLHFAETVARLHSNKGITGQTKLSNNGINGGGCFSILLP